MKSICVLLFFLSLGFGLELHAHGTFDPQDPVITQWLKLLQYQKKGESFQSKVQTPDFFIKSEGSTDPAGELAAEIAIFQKEENPSDRSAQCQFPARYAVLRKRFPLSPPHDCQALRHWRENYAISYASVIYTSQYLSNPASVFGHTYFLLGSNSLPEYLQITLNYAADIPEHINSLAYAYYGITGGFSGAFSMVPFYQNQQIYSNIESREMWEYKLKLDPDELELLINELWELKNRARFSYYFLDENCGAVLLWVLAAVKPEADFSSSNPVYFPPAEVTKVLQKNHLVAEVIFHPSLNEKILNKIDHMNLEQKALFKKLLTEKKRGDEVTDTLVLETLMDHLSLERNNSGGVLSPELSSLERQVLLARAKEPADSQDFPYPAEAIPRAPDLAHGSMRVQMGLGDDNGISTELFEFRPAIHGLLDRDEGFLKNSHIEIFSVKLQHSPTRGLELESLHLADLANIRAVDFYQSPLSWQFHADQLRNDWQSGESQYFELGFDFGYAKDFFSPNFTSYAMIETAARSGARPLGRSEVGPELGVLYSWRRFKGQLQVTHATELMDQSVSGDWRMKAQLRFELSNQWSLFFNEQLDFVNDQSSAHHNSQFLVSFYF